MRQKQIIVILMSLLIASRLYKCYHDNYSINNGLINVSKPINGICKVPYNFNYGGYEFTDSIEFNYTDYTFYKNLSKSQEFNQYALEYKDHQYLLKLASKLDKDAKTLGYKDIELAEYIISFVQSIPYHGDPSYEYPKYPIETLVEFGGDCEDKAILLVSLLKVFGFDAVLVELPGHMAAAVSCSNCDGYYNYNNKHYSFIETTEEGWQIGNVPPEYSSTGGTILETPELIQYNRDTVPNKSDNTKLVNEITPSKTPSTNSSISITINGKEYIISRDTTIDNVTIITE